MKSNFKFKNFFFCVILSISLNSFAQITISANTTWNAMNPPPIGASGGVNITSSAILLIDGITINFNPGAQLIVQPSSKLSCNNVIFKTASQNTPWNGIILNGNASVNQFTTSPNLTVLNNQGTWSGTLNSNQTYCLLENCTFENVLTGVRVVNGAILRARNSFFKDFVLGISIEGYTSSNFPLYNACYIMECNFLWQTISTNTNFINSSTNLTGIKIEDADGVNIGGCDFECNYPSNERDLLERGIGISAIHSNLNISQSGNVWCLDDEGCLNNCSGLPKNNYFKKLSQGLIYNGLNPNKTQYTDRKTISIRNSEFTNVLFDMQILNSIQPVVGKVNSSGVRTTLSQLYKDFCDNTNTPPICTRKQILKITDCEGLNVYKNNFYFNGLGCIYAEIINCGKSSSSFINNTFIENSGQAVATNSLIGDDVYGLYLDGDCEGLSVHCNVFSDMGVDIYLDENAIFWKNSTAGNYILVTEKEAGNNEFSTLIQGRENILISDLNNCPLVLKYNYYNNNSLDNFVYYNTNLGKVLNNLNKSPLPDPPDCSSPCPKLFQSLSTLKLVRNDNYQIYPNPAKSELMINNLSEKDNINVYDISGQLVLFKQNIQQNVIDISMLNPGMYFIKIIGISSSKKLKFVKI